MTKQKNTNQQDDVIYAHLFANVHKGNELPKDATDVSYVVMMATIPYNGRVSLDMNDIVQFINECRHHGLDISEVSEMFQSISIGALKAVNEQRSGQSVVDGEKMSEMVTRIMGNNFEDKTVSGQGQYL